MARKMTTDKEKAIVKVNLVLKSLLSRIMRPLNLLRIPSAKCPNKVW